MRRLFQRNFAEQEEVSSGKKSIAVQLLLNNRCLGTWLWLGVVGKG